MFSTFMIGNYQEVIEKNFISILYYTLIFFEENYSKLGYLKPAIYIYYAKLKDKTNFQKTFREAVNEGMENKERDYYRIL